MRILLITPPTLVEGKEYGEVFKSFMSEPIGLEMLAAMVAGENEVEILDLSCEPDLDLHEKLDHYKPDLVGVTCMGMRIVYNARKVLKAVKAYDNNIITMVGGIPVSLVPEEFNREYIDLLAIGEGEITFKELVQALNQRNGYKTIKGLAYRENGRLVFTPSRPLIENLDSLPLPRRDLIDKYMTFYRDRLFQLPNHSFYTSRGCPYRCGFCSVNKFYGRAIRYQSPERFIDELSASNAEVILLVDDNFLNNPERAEKIADMIKERGLERKYIGLSSRSNNIIKAESILKKWRGLTDELGVCIGLEGISDDWLKKLKKGSTVEMNNRAIDILHENDIHISGSFIVDPDCGTEHFDALARYVKEKDISLPFFYSFIPSPDDPLYKDRVCNTDWRYYDGWNIVVKPALPIEDYKKGLEKLWNLTKARALKLMMKVKSKFDNKEPVRAETKGHYF
ncbi:MAG: cobalamin-dependent protein [Spirochaetales bacterium]|nr:cobalamin-dependent protein [Spirochaetales bacterium]